jgi:VWFA-related protein
VPSPPPPSSDYPSLLTEYQSILIREGDKEALALALEENKGTAPPTRGNTPTTPDLQGALQQVQAIDAVKGKAGALASVSDRTTQNTLASLERHVRSLRGLPGRKILVMLSGGRFWGRAGAGTSEDFDLASIADAAVRAGVVLHVVNTHASAPSPIGKAAGADVRSRIEGQASEAARNGQGRLAEWTGGMAFAGSNDMGNEWESILEDSVNYYRLEYERRPTASHEFFRMVVVRVATRFSRLRIRAAAGYTVRSWVPPFGPME